jgi:UDP-N-acetylmuramate-alanine ligase
MPPLTLILGLCISNDILKGGVYNFQTTNRKEDNFSYAAAEAIESDSSFRKS